ncbi:MAG: S41 family peptidase [Chloroflexota bacterium]|nr:S41 family peptidase [Chloroflexota bacterium]MDE3103110.1 S41 family peptidase [Chloroflexota bacterium]
MARARTLAVLSLVLVVLASACQLLPADVAKQVLPDQTDYKTLEAAYHVLLERHVDRPGSKQLLTGALDGADAYFAKPADQKGPNCPSDKAQRPQLTGATESDLVKASQSLDKALAACPAANKDLLEEAAVDGMAKSMNECHTYYLDPERAKAFNQPPQPYSGIGATIIASTTPGGPSEISSVFPGSPAERAGVQPGDKVKEVNGKNVVGFSPDEVATNIRGPEGTSVTLVLIRGTKEITVTITRATLTPPRVIETSYDQNKIAELSVSQLNGDVAKQTQDGVESAVRNGAQGLILDLRDDPGGDLSAAVDIASIFVKNATLVDQVGRDGKKQPLKTDDKWYVGFSGPLVVLVNQRSASGAEIIAAGLQSNGVAEVVGTRTAGCVGIAQPREMPDGGLLLVTLARMEDEKTGAPLNGAGRGVEPNVVAPDDPNTPQHEDLDAALKVERQKIAEKPLQTSEP